MTRQEFFASLEDYIINISDPQPQTEPDKPFVQVYKNGKHKGERVKGIVSSVILYPDTPSHIKALNLLFDLGYNFCCILHDSDYVDDDKVDSTQSTNQDDIDMDDSDLSDGIPTSSDNPKLKKAHIHVVILFQNGRTNTGVAKTLKIPSRLVRIVNGLNVRLAYLVHRDNLDKYQYNPDRIAGTMLSRIPTAIESVHGYLPDMVCDIGRWIDGYKDVKKLTWLKVVEFCNKNGYNDVLYNSKSSYFQTVRQMFFDKKSQEKIEDFDLKYAKTLTSLKLENQTLHAQMRLLCEMLDVPIVSNGMFSDTIYENQNNNLKNGG